jgi:Tol biopolymer transport system component
MGADGSNLEQLYEGPIQQVTLSPDGKMLTMLVSDGKQSKIQILHLVQTPYMQIILDSMNWEAANDSVAFRDLNWSPDGSQLIFAANPHENYDLFLWDQQSEILTQVTNTSADETLPLWRPYVDDNQ